MAEDDPMRLTVLLPTEILLDRGAARVVAEGEEGAFGILPRHIDYVAALTAGLLTYEETGQGGQVNLAINGGTLVKCGSRVRVSTPAAVLGPDLASLDEVIRTQFAALDERERRARTALTRLEAGTLRRFMELEELERGG